MKNRNYFLIFIFACCSGIVCTAEGQNKNRHYIKNRIMTTEDGNSFREKVLYYDIFGKHTETVQVGASPQGKDLNFTFGYDILDRPVGESLPLPDGNRNYYGDAFPYSGCVYGNSSLNRIREFYGPGAAWWDNGKTVKNEYFTNSTSGLLCCAEFRAEDSGGDVKLIRSGMYAAGELTVTKTTDEDGKIVYTFTDFEGKLLLTRRMNGAEPHDTYIVYDARGRKRIVLPPLAADELTATASWLCNSSEVIKKYGYVYRYDGRDRVIEKKLPGCDPVHFVYDRSDRLILKQNGNNRKDGEWQYYQYDGLGREVIWGVLPSSAGREDWEEIFRDTVYCERFIGLGQTDNFGYSNTSAFNESRIPLIISYYDSYGFEALSDSFLTFVDKPEFGKRIERPTGKLTGQIIALLNNPELKEHVTHYYDNRGREIQTNACSISGFHNYSFTKYDFIGQPISVRKEHYSIYPAKAILEPEATYDHTIVYDYEYDHAGRVTRLYQTFDKNERIKIAEYRYDEAGRLVGKELHDGKFECKYDYNIRGWLTEIDEPFMNEKIYYNEDLPEGVEPLYNGNIADVYYSAHDSAHFRLSYDGLNRLTASQQYTRNGVKTAAAETFAYDKMGNITSIVRSTEKPIPNYINRVQLFYDGNRIIRGEGSPYYGDYNDMVYPNYSGRDVEYEYDPNGNLIKNSDNRISMTTYNLLNLPQTVAFSDKSLSVFYYMADGRKVRNAAGSYSISTAVPIDSVIKNTDPYISYMSEWNDVYWYQGKLQKYINTPEGNIEVSTGRKMSFSYYYISKDHLGSIWHYWNSLSNKYSNIYYPSGIMREKRRSPYNYGLTGKEIVYDNGLDEYFFGARTLFAPINRFNQPDPLCEEYYHISPYAYCANNFINAVDPDGRKVKPAGTAELIMIQNTLPKDARNYVKLDKNGLIDRTLLNSYGGKSLNFNNLKTLVNSNRMVEVVLDNKFTFMEQNGRLGTVTMSYNDFDPIYDSETDKDLTGETMGGLSTGESGFMGKTLFPDKEGIQNSPNNNIIVIINKNLSPAGAAEIYSHEANGHVLLYINNGGNHKGASHQPVDGGWIEGNKILMEMIIKSKKETIKNMQAR